MSDELGNNEGTAQPSAAPAEQQTNQEGSGIQRRFDELTAKLYEKDSIIQQQAQAIAQAMAAQATRSQPAPAPVDEVDAEISALEQYSPEIARTLRNTIAKVEARMGQAIQKTQRTLETQAVVKDIQREVLTAGVKDPKVAARAEELIVSWRANGLTYTPRDALSFALGEAQLQPQPRAQDGRYAPVDAVLTGASAPPAPAPARGQRPPSNFDSMSADQQIAWFETQGLGDKPF